jgi:hypothetical protein
MHRHRMSSIHDPTQPRTRPPGAELLPVLVWLNRCQLASRFPAWQTLPGHHAGEGELERSSGSNDSSGSSDTAEHEPPR